MTEENAGIRIVSLNELDFKSKMTIQHTQQPITTGSSVLGVKYKDGVILASDTMVAYGNSLKFPNQKRMHVVGENTVVGASGEFSDFQAIQRLVNDVEEEDWINQDGSRLGPKEVASFLGRVLYNRRSKINPLWNQLVIGGIKHGKHHLAYADLQGTCFEEDFIATGFGMHLALPILRKHADDGKWKTLDEKAAKAVLEECLKLLFYRDCKASCHVQFCVSNASGTKLETPYRLETHWTHPTWMKAGKELNKGTQSW